MAANTSWMKARQTKFAAYTAVYVLIVLAVIGVLNFLANRYNKTLRHHQQQAVHAVRSDRSRSPKT